ncbi:MAG: heavy metal response regulator transcription factor [Legionellaceae bacterium]|nr:heavy metal response regulator transcription factor [Legionellaceae bacterium]
MRILIVEDNSTAAGYLYKGLKEHGFTPEIAADGQEGLHLALNHPYDVMIFDVMMPVINGWELIQKIRQNNIKTPVLFLTAHDSVQDRVKGLELGADDYLIKPFAFSELLARLQTIVRRTQAPASRVLLVADLLIDQDKYRATRAGRVLSLTAKEFMLLSLFANKIGQPLTRTYIAEQVWDIHFDSNTNAIDVAVKRLRDKVDMQAERTLIHTVRGIGYVMEVR